MKPKKGKCEVCWDADERGKLKRWVLQYDLWGRRQAVPVTRGE